MLKQSQRQSQKQRQSQSPRQWLNPRSGRSVKEQKCKGEEAAQESRHEVDTSIAAEEKFGILRNALLMSYFIFVCFVHSGTLQEHVLQDAGLQDCSCFILLSVTLMLHLINQTINKCKQTSTTNKPNQSHQTNKFNVIIEAISSINQCMCMCIVGVACVYCMCGVRVHVYVHIMPLCMYACMFVCVLHVLV